MLSVDTEAGAAGNGIAWQGSGPFVLLLKDDSYWSAAGPLQQETARTESLVETYG
jgi:hypothetical protein